MTSEHFAIQCPPCPVCGIRALLEVDEDRFTKWLVLRYDVQVAFPEFDADQRELMITGTHAHCWQTMFGGEDAA